jgi:hypothetical protein
MVGDVAVELCCWKQLNWLMAARLAYSSHLNVRHLFSTIWYLSKIKDGNKLYRINSVAECNVYFSERLSKVERFNVIRRLNTESYL